MLPLRVGNSARADADAGLDPCAGLALSDIVGEWTAMHAALKSTQAASQTILSGMKSSAAALEAVQVGLAAAGGARGALPSWTTEWARPITEALASGLVEAFSASVLQPLAAVLGVFAELEKRVAARQRADAEFQAAQRALGALQRRATPRRGLLGRIQGGGTGGAVSRAGDDVRQAAVERLARTQATLEGLDSMLTEQLADWLRHRPALASLLAESTAMCLASHVAAAGRIAAACASPGPDDGSGGFEGTAVQDRAQALGGAEWWLPPRLRSAARGAHALVLRVAGRAVREPPLVATGSLPWALGPDGDLRGIVAQDGAVLAAQGSRDGRGPSLSKRVREQGGVWLSRRLAPEASFRSGRHDGPPGAPMGSRDVELTRWSRGSSVAARELVVLDEDTATDSEIGQRIAVAQQAGKAAFLLTSPALAAAGGASHSAGAAPLDGSAAGREAGSASVPRDRVLFRRRWLRRVCQGLGLEDLGAMRLVCKRWAAVIRTDRDLWLGCVWAGAVSAAPRLRPRFWAWVSGAAGQPPPHWSRTRGIVFLPSDVGAAQDSATSGNRDSARAATDAAAPSGASHPGSAAVMGAPGAWAMQELPVCSKEEFDSVLRASLADVRERSAESAPTGGSWASTLEQDVLRTPGCVAGTVFGQLPGRRRRLDLDSAGTAEVAAVSSKCSDGQASPRPGGESAGPASDDSTECPAAAGAGSSGGGPLSVAQSDDDGESIDIEAVLAREQLEAAMNADAADVVALGELGGCSLLAEGGAASSPSRSPGAEAARAPEEQAARLRSILLVGAQTFSVGYVQGMNHLTMMLLSNCDVDAAAGARCPASAREQESDDAMALAFTLLRQIMGGRGLESLLAREMLQLKALLFQLDALVHDQLPKLARVLDEADLRPAMYAGAWVLTLFASHRVLPPGAAVIVWDAFLAGGWTEAYRAVLAVLCELEPVLLTVAGTARDADEVMEALLPVLQSPRAYLDPETRGPLSEEVFCQRVLARACSLRLRSTHLRALASAHAGAMAKRDELDSLQARGIRGAVQTRLREARARFRRASNAVRNRRAAAAAGGAGASSAAGAT